jgi:thiazole synthase ThiGH ThiG subunit
VLQSTVHDIRSMNLINWKIGDEMNYNIKMFIGGGTLKKVAVREEGTALWFNQEIKLMGQNQKIEVLINRPDGKILKVIQNGQEQAVPNTSDIEVIEQEVRTVTVPAGTFESVYIKAKTQGKVVQMWANPAETVMDGALKQIVPTGIIGDMTMELVNFKHGPEVIE